MQPDEFFARLDERRAAESRATRQTYGMDVKPFTQAEAEEYLKDAVACPACGGPIHIKNGVEPQLTAVCRSCGQLRRLGKEGRVRGTMRYMENPEPDYDSDIEQAIQAYAIRKKRGK